MPLLAHGGITEAALFPPIKKDIGGVWRMNALEFLANIERKKGMADTGREVTKALPSQDEELSYYHMYRENGSYAYEYLTLTSRWRQYGISLMEFKVEIERLPVKTQYEILQGMEKIEMEPAPNWYLGLASVCKYPLYSVRGTCNMEKECRREPLCCKVHDKPCCFGKSVGCSDISAIEAPCHSELFPEFLIWMSACPDMDVLYVMHDYPSVFLDGGALGFPYGFLLKDHKITYIGDSREVERLYKEYNKKYPCDTFEVEEALNGLDGDVPPFHF